MNGDDISKLVSALASMPPVQAAAAALGGVAAWLIWKDRNIKPRVDPLVGISNQIESLSRKTDELHAKLHDLQTTVAYMRGQQSSKDRE